MGMLKDLYGEAEHEERQMNIDFPIRGVSITVHRPHSDEVTEVRKRSSKYKGQDDYAIWKRVAVLKMLSDEPCLREEDDIVLFEDVKAMEIPDQRAIDSAWALMLGDIPDNLKDAVGHELFRQTSTTETG